MAETLDPVTALTYALSCSTDSPEQATALKALRAVFEAQPATIPQFCPTLLGNAVAGKDSLFKRFTIELFGYALGTNSLSLELRMQREFRYYDSLIVTVLSAIFLKFFIRYPCSHLTLWHTFHPCIPLLTRPIYHVFSRGVFIYPVASDCLELAATLLAGAENSHILKLIIQCFCNIYPLLFRLM